MSGVMLNLEGSLITDLETWKAAHSSVAGIAYPNKEFTPPAVDDLTKAWAEVNFFPKETRQAGVGDAGYNEMGGIMMVNIRVPKGSTAGAAKALADALVTAFKRGTNCTAVSGYVARVKNAWQSSPITEEAWFNVPVNIQWYQHVSNV